eukprot:1160679-Pelagomonas_calceolata.AAC.13
MTVKADIQGAETNGMQRAWQALGIAEYLPLFTNYFEMEHRGPKSLPQKLLQGELGAAFMHVAAPVLAAFYMARHNMYNQMPSPFMIIHMKACQSVLGAKSSMHPLRSKLPLTNLRNTGQ